MVHDSKVMEDRGLEKFCFLREDPMAFKFTAQDKIRIPIGEVC